MSSLSTMQLRRWQQRAQSTLSREWTPPQRYGTAFHITAPYLDVRTLPLPKFSQTLSRNAPEKTLSSISLADHKILAQQFTDAYTTWHVAHLDRLGFQLIHVPAGTHQALSFGEQSSNFTSSLVWIVLEAGAHLVIQDTLADHDLALRRVAIVQHEHSQLTYWAVRTRNIFLNERLTVHLVGDAASANITHLVFANSRHQADSEVRVWHEAPDTTTQVTVRAAAHQAQSIYRALSTITPAAVTSRSQQAGRALLLAPGSVIDILPELDIQTGNVQCGHGVTTTHLDDASLWYLRSRGLPAQQARQIMTEAFFHQNLSVPATLSAQVTKTTDILYGEKT